MLKIGLTGGIGSGKSSVAKLFADLAIPVIDADVIARQVVNDTKIVTQIVQHFGAEVANAAGDLNRSRLRQIIFADPAERRWLEALLHPLIIQEIQHLLAHEAAPYSIIVIPLLIEATDPYTLVDRILLVDAPEKIQIKRTIARDNLTEEEVNRILASQATRAQRLKMADDVIVNDRDLAYLAESISKLHHLYLNLAASKGK